MAGSAADYVTIIAGFLSIVASFLNFPIFTVIVVLLFVLSACTSVYIITRLLLVVNKSHGNLIYRLKHIYMTAINTHKQEDFNCTQLMQKYDSDFYTILGELCKLIKIITKKEINACIKLVNMDDEGTLFVLRRSQLYAEDRCIYTKAIILDENTLLTGVLKSTPRKLFVPDIEEYVKLVGAQGEEFRHSNPNWRAHYSSTVIVPILAPSINNYVLNSAFSGSVIGFLCIDCKSTKAFTKLNKSIILDIMDSFSDALYMLLSQYMHYACKYNVICGNAEEVTSN